MESFLYVADNSKNLLSCKANLVVLPEQVSNACAKHGHLRPQKFLKTANLLIEKAYFRPIMQTMHARQHQPRVTQAATQGIHQTFTVLSRNQFTKPF